jgi:hypothetical protein
VERGAVAGGAALHGRDRSPCSSTSPPTPGSLFAGSRLAASSASPSGCSRAWPSTST